MKPKKKIHEKTTETPFFDKQKENKTKMNVKEFNSTRRRGGIQGRRRRTNYYAQSVKKPALLTIMKRNEKTEKTEIIEMTLNSKKRWQILDNIDDSGVDDQGRRVVVVSQPISNMGGSVSMPTLNDGENEMIVVTLPNENPTRKIEHHRFCSMCNTPKTPRVRRQRRALRREAKPEIYFN